VPALCNSLVRTDAADVDLLAGVRHGQSVSAPIDDRVRIHVVQSRTRVASQAGLQGRRLMSHIFATSDIDVVHLHGLWHPLNHWATSLARRHGAKIAMSPRGTLEPWSLAWKSRKKRLAMIAYQWRDLDKVDAFIATADQEADSIERLGLDRPIAVIPNGISLPTSPAVRSDRGHEHPRVLLFMSRIHPKKGLVELLHAWRATAGSGWVLKIAGPDEAGHLADVQKLIDQLDIRETVSYIGPVSEEQKPRQLLEADAFVLPSHSENFGMVVAEALSFGLPVIATVGTPWQSIEAQGCGWWVTPDLPGLSSALAALFQLDEAELSALGLAARSLASRFDWTQIATDTIDVYNWLHNGQSRPKALRCS
jgi:glycosyltransferase involved in cell wall biosynthesis